MYFSRSINKSGEDVVGTVNKLELEDNSYGTKEKPIPIIYVQRMRKETYTFYSLVKGDDKAQFHGSEADFKKYMLNYNAGHYLSYMKSKPDFEKMFGKQKKAD